MIIAVDFDGTLSLGKYPAVGPANKQMIQYIKSRQKMGDQIILWTCRERGDLDEAVKWCQKQGLIFDAVNDNVPEVIELWGANSRKIDCDLYIDDKAMFEEVYSKYPVDIN